MKRTHPWITALACAAAMAAQAQDESHLPLLPPTASVQQVLEQLPQVRAAGAAVALAQARSQRLQAGPHDWVAKAGGNRRSEQTGPRYRESEIGLETGLRWPAKVTADRQLGAVEERLGHIGYADAWHEAARGLLADWFEVLRDMRGAQLLQAQDTLMQRQLQVTQRRVDTGDAAALDLLAANAERARVQAQATRTRAQAELRRYSLLRRYPGLADPADLLAARPPNAWLAPAPLADGTDSASASSWVERMLDDNHELERAQVRAEQARLQAERARLERQPDATVGVRATRERGGQEQVLGVYLSLPLGGAGRAADARAALAQADIADQDLAQTHQRVQAEAWRTASEAQQTLATLVSQRHALEQLEKNAALQERAYALGESPLVDLLLAQRGALEAQLMAETSALDAMQAQARMLLDAHRLWRPPGH
ncbi:TolC family protein [Alicycliphilus denitrificans]|uniref:TolC family protein n=1 Tax=Alicycliphilus denitrificans TaxID=179636 RepID=UPI00384C41D2